MALSFEDGLKQLQDILRQQAAASGSDQDHDTEHEAPTYPTPGYNVVSAFSALSAARDDKEDESIISAQLTGVKLSRERYSAYNKMFYPKAPGTFLPIVDELAELSARVNGIFSLLRFCLASSRRLSMLDKTERAQTINREAERILKNVMGGSRAEVLDNFLTSASSGKNHVIVPSIRYPGGYDIQFVGSPSSPNSATEANLPSVYVPYAENGVIDVTPGGKEHHPIYQREYLEAYASDFAQGAVEAGYEILEVLLGSAAGSYASAPKRLIRTVPLDFDFQQINEIFFKHTGVVLTVDFLQNVHSSVVSRFNEFFSVTVIRTPRMELIRNIKAKMDAQRRSAEEGQAPAPVSSDFLESIITREGLALSQIISFSFSVSLPEDISQYISQAPEGENVSVASIHNWVGIWTRRYVRKKGARISGGSFKRNEMPRFVPPLSKTKDITKLRTQNDFHVEPGKGDEHGIFIAPDGSLQYGLPTSAKDQIEENLTGYEKALDEYLSFCFEHNIPPQNTAALPRECVVGSDDPNIESQYKELFTNIRKYSGKLLSYDWDYNNTITANVTDPTSIVPRDLVGAARTDSLSVADYLGYNFAEEGEEPIRKSFADSLVLMTNTKLGSDEPNSSAVSDANTPVKFMQFGGVAPQLLEFYAYQMMKDRVPTLPELVKEAAQELGITEQSEMDVQILAGMFKDTSLEVGENYAPDQPRDLIRFLENALTRTIVHCDSGPLFRQMVYNENEGISPGDLANEVENHPHYFNPRRSPAADFGRLYNYLGGMIFKVAMDKLTTVSPKDLFSVEAPIALSGYGDNQLVKPNFTAISRQILPLAVMFSKYVPNGEQYFREAEELVEANKGDPSIDESDIRVSGAIEGAQMFPHQVRAHQNLRKRPAFSILDIAPGGGKTTLGVTDIAAMVTELNEIGENNIKPIILCPDGLIKNWVDDMKIFTGNKWNMIPVNTAILNRWGYDRLEELIRSAPPNSVVVTGFNFLNNKKETIAVGTHSVRVSNNLEFMKRFGFDYICIDESHKLKKKASQRHKNIKQFTTGSHVRYLRLATGTLISDRVSDIVGQASLYNGHIFRDGEVSNSPVSEVERKISLNGDEVPLWQVDSPQRARQKLGRYASVITMKKKEWAFMLPSPIETFIAVPMVPEDDSASSEDVRLGELHKQLYDAVLQESVEQLEELLKKAKKGKGEDDDEDDEDEDEDDDAVAEAVDIDLGDADDLALLGATKLHPYLARIERLVTNPMADPLAPEVFGAAGVKHYHSTKAKYVARRIDKHFNPEKWKKDKLYKEYTLVEHDGRLFLSRKLDKSSPNPTDLPEETRGKSPVDDTETWKEEPEGKIVIFCRYTNSVNGIYNALPAEYKRIAVKFTGEEDDKWANLDAFLNDSKIKVLVANEMGIAEGHNMQLASRIIRIESPWAPGDLDQASSRIFRPDPQAQKDMVNSGKPGELAREAIFLDWILCDNTMEVAKQARLISKIFNKARFDEAENETYDDVLSAYELDEIRMSLDTLRSRASLSEYSEYVEAYAALNGLQREEFHEMRATMDHTMKPLEAQPEVPGSAKVPTPFVSNQKPDNSEGLNLITLRNMLRNEEHKELKDDPSRLRGMPIVTDLGKGRIAQVTIRYLQEAKLDADGNYIRNAPSGRNPLGTIKKEKVLDSQGRAIVDPDSPISSMKVKLAGSNDIVDIKNTGDVFMPTTLDAKTAKRDFHVNNLNVTVTQERKSARAEERRRREEEKEQREREAEEEKDLIREEKRRRKEKQQAEARLAAGEDGKKRKRNIEEGKPINTGIRRTPNVPPIKRGRMGQDADGDMTVTVHPAYFHGYLTLEMRSDDTDPKIAKKLGFKETGPYAYVKADRYARFDKVLDYLEEHFHLSDASARRLEEVQDAFDTGPKEIYRMELMSKTSLPMFFAVTKRKVTKRNEVRPYPIIMPNELQIAVDIRTSPAVTKHIGKSVPGAVTKWREHPGHFLFFAQSKSDLKSKMRDLKKAGITIANEDEAKAEVTNIRFRASKNKKK